jgi:peptidyl-prolyl cis-trans isomerase D
LIKVTELVPGEVKTFETVKPELSKAYKKAQAESRFNELAEKLSQVSYENPESLDATSNMLGVEIQETAMFTRQAGEGVANDEKLRLAAFSEDVLKGSNSEPVEVGTDKLVVLRMKSHVPAANKELNDVKKEVIAALQKDKAQQHAIEVANQIKADLSAGKTISEVAQAAHLNVKKVNGLARSTADVDPAVSQAIFRAPKPQANRPSIVIIDEPAGGKILASINAVKDGEMTEADKAKLAVIEKNMATAFGRAQFESVLNQLQVNADIKIHEAKQ